MTYHFRTWPPTAEDIDLLVQIGTGESTNLEFKQEMPESGAFRKEVCAFANAHGGEIVIGIQEKNGIAAGVLPQQVKNPDNEELKIHEMIRTATTPPIPGVKVAVIPMGDGHVTAVRVPKSWIGPHMDSSKKVFIRESTQSRPMEHIELKNAFLGAEEQALRLRRLRTQQCDAIINRDTPVQMEYKRSIVTHVMPMDALAGGRRFNAKALLAALKDARPTIGMGHNTRVDANGAFQLLTKGGPPHHGMYYAHVSYNGVVEIVNCMTLTNTLRDGDVSHSMFDQQFAQAVLESAGILSRLELEPPYVVFLSLLDVKNIKTNAADLPEPVRKDEVFAHEVAITEIPATFQEMAKSIKSALDEIANGFGLSSSPSFSLEGEWKFHNGC